LDQELTYKWIQERLRDLHSGRLTEQDKARLQEIARQDPFVADALEGFNAHPDIEHATHLERLTAKINLQKRPRRRWLIPNLTVTAIAASVMLIIATYAVITRIHPDAEESRMVILTPDSLITGDTSIHDAVVWNDKVEDSSKKVESSSEKVEVKREVEKVESEKLKDEDIAASEPAVSVTGAVKYDDDQIKEAKDMVTVPPAGAIEPKDVATSMPAVESQPSTTKLSEASDVRAKRDEGYYANQMDPGLMAKRVTGRVVDAQTGEPLINAKLTVSYSNQNFYTGMEGYFELFIPEPEAVLHVTFTGLVDSTLIIRQGEENILIGLNVGAMIPPMIIIDMGPGTKNLGPVPPTKNPAIEAFLNFSRYITSSSFLQLSTEPSSARRKVTLEFKVKKDGIPGDIKIMESSRDKTYDEEAVRLIKNGPAWVCPGGEYPCVRSYTIYFQ
jgi:CarboxypepD_reg-like domain